MYIVIVHPLLAKSAVMSANPHTFLHTPLKRACTPLSPLGSIAAQIYPQHQGILYTQVSEKRKTSLSEKFYIYSLYITYGAQEGS